MVEEIKSSSKASSAFEAKIRSRSRPMLSSEERQKLAKQKRLEQTVMAAERCREAAAEQLKRAEYWDNELARLEAEG